MVTADYTVAAGVVVKIGSGFSQLGVTAAIGE
jgi:hypothetical protein